MGTTTQKKGGTDFETKSKRYSGKGTAITNVSSVILRPPQAAVALTSMLTPKSPRRFGSCGYTGSSNSSREANGDDVFYKRPLALNDVRDVRLVADDVPLLTNLLADVFPEVDHIPVDLSAVNFSKNAKSGVLCLANAGF
ncbi:dynein heavy chain [Marasmius sp. AFHP31]|nr:dynein heavy chain [Marasmius sp. AFHP31]